jgi:hypothetical protein
MESTWRGNQELAWPEGYPVSAPQKLLSLSSLTYVVSLPQITARLTQMKAFCICQSFFGNLNQLCSISNESCNASNV